MHFSLNINVLTLEMTSSQKGNVLFLILIAVALFAALAYAVTASSRGEKTSTTTEIGDVTAGRILNFATALQAGVLRLSTIKGVPPAELKYNNDVSTSIDGSTYFMGAMGTPSDPSLYVFHPQGGGVVAQKFEDAVTPCIGCGTAQLKGGHFNIVWINLPGSGTELGDVVMLITDLRDDACQAINRKLGFDFIPNVVLGAGNVIAAATTPPSGMPATTGVTTADFDAINGKQMYCVKKANSPIRNHFFTVLKAY